MTAAADVTVVVPTFRRTRILAELLSAIRELDPAPAEVIVVAGDEASAETARTYGVRLIEVDNRNASASRNAGWRAATTDVVAFLDDDCRPGRGWLASVIEALDRPQADGTVPAAVGGPVSDSCPERLASRIAQRWLDRRYEPGPAEWLASQNFAARRTVLDQIGGFDEEFATYEDIDLSTRITNGGGVLYREPAMAVAHRHRDRVRDLVRQHRGYGHGFVQMARKHPTWDQAGRAPLDGRRIVIALAFAVGRPFVCAKSMTSTRDRIASLPVFAARELGFLAGALGEARR